jgi:hypothetical protein
MGLIMIGALWRTGPVGCGATCWGGRWYMVAGGSGSGLNMNGAGAGAGTIRPNTLRPITWGGG